MKFKFTNGKTTSGIFWREKEGRGRSHEENLTSTWDLPNQFKRGMGERGKDKEDTIFLLPPLGPT